MTNGGTEMTIETIFARFAMKTTQREPVATEGLAFVLRKSAACRAALSDWARAFVPDFPEIERVIAEDTEGADDGRPDVAGYDGNQKLRLLIEGKFWAGLTDNQPGTYLERLRDDGGVLIFLVPDKRIDTVWAEVCERIEGNGTSLDEPTTLPNGSRAAALGDGRFVGITTWRTLLGMLTRAAKEANELAAAADLEQLAGLADAMETEGFVPITREELGDLDVPRRMIMLADLVEAVVAKTNALGLTTTKGLRATHGWYSSGRYIRLPRGGGWFGIDCWRWARHGASPLWLAFGASEWGKAPQVAKALASWRLAREQRVFIEDDGRTAVALLIAPGRERPAVVDDVVDQLKQIDAAMEVAGIAIHADEQPVEPD